jgi:hypothetical protein
MVRLRHIATLGVACAAFLSFSTVTAAAQAPNAVSTPEAPIILLLPTSPPEPPAWLAFEHAWTVVAAYTATITVFERSGTKTQNWVMDYTFRKPSSVTVHVIKGSNAGATLVWSGGTTVVGHRGSGLLAMIKKSFPLHDPQVTTIRGSSIDELSFAAFLTHAQGTPGSTSQGAGPAIDGIPTEAVTLIPTSAVADTGLTHEVAEISTMTSLPIRVLGYDGETLVRQVDFANIKLELLPVSMK